MLSRRVLFNCFPDIFFGTQPHKCYVTFRNYFSFHSTMYDESSIYEWIYVRMHVYIYVYNI